MNGSITVSISRSAVVPTENRVEWLEKHGVVAENFEVQATADLRTWSRIARIAADGEVSWAMSKYDIPARAVEKALEEAITARLREDPTNLSDFDATSIIEAEAAKAEAKAREEAATAEREAAEKAAFSAKISALTVDLLDPDGVLIKRFPDDPVLDALVRRNLGLPRTDRDQRMVGIIEEQDKRVAAAKQRKIAELSAWVAEHGAGIFEPNVIRAASEGRDVRGLVRQTIADRISAAIAAPACFGTHDGYDWEEDKRAPSQTAYEIRDVLVAAEPSLREAAALPGATVEISDFGRYDVCEESGRVWRTAIEVTISMPWVSPLTEYVLTEPLNYEPAEEEDD